MSWSVRGAHLIYYRKVGGALEPVILGDLQLISPYDRFKETPAPVLPVGDLVDRYSDEVIEIFGKLRTP